MKKGRPYPKDPVRRRLVRIELVKRDMSISELARALGIHCGNLSAVINGRRVSPKTEAKIAAYFGLSVEDLFPPRKKRDFVGTGETAV